MLGVLECEAGKPKNNKKSKKNGIVLLGTKSKNKRQKSKDNNPEICPHPLDGLGVGKVSITRCDNVSCQAPRLSMRTQKGSCFLRGGSASHCLGRPASSMPATHERASKLTQKVPNRQPFPRSFSRGDVSASRETDVDKNKRELNRRTST